MTSKEEINKKKLVKRLKQKTTRAALNTFIIFGISATTSAIGGGLLDKYLRTWPLVTIIFFIVFYIISWVVILKNLKKISLINKEKNNE